MRVPLWLVHTETKFVSGTGQSRSTKLLQLLLSSRLSPLPHSIWKSLCSVELELVRPHLIFVSMSEQQREGELSILIKEGEDSYILSQSGQVPGMRVSASRNSQHLHVPGIMHSMRVPGAPRNTSGRSYHMRQSVPILGRKLQRPEPFQTSVKSGERSLSRSDIFVRKIELEIYSLKNENCQRFLRIKNW